MTQPPKDREPPQPDVPPQEDEGVRPRTQVGPGLGVAQPPVGAPLLDEPTLHPTTEVARLEPQPDAEPTELLPPVPAAQRRDRPTRQYSDGHPPAPVEPGPIDEQRPRAETVREGQIDREVLGLPRVEPDELQPADDQAPTVEVEDAEAGPPEPPPHQLQLRRRPERETVTQPDLTPSRSRPRAQDRETVQELDDVLQRRRPERAPGDWQGPTTAVQRLDDLTPDQDVPTVPDDNRLVSLTDARDVTPVEPLPGVRDVTPIEPLPPVRPRRPDPTKTWQGPAPGPPRRWPVVALGLSVVAALALVALAWWQTREKPRDDMGLPVPPPSPAVAKPTVSEPAVPEPVAKAVEPTVPPPPKAADQPPPVAEAQPAPPEAVVAPKPSEELGKPAPQDTCPPRAWLVAGTASDEEAPYLALRDEPGADGALLARLPDGTRLKVLGSQGRWREVSVCPGQDLEAQTGWVHGRWLKQER